MVAPPIRRSRSSGQSGSTHLIGWLGHDSQSANVLATAQMHLNMRSAVVSALPANMRSAFEVIKLDNQVLTLMVSSAAFAAKFRQLAPRVTAHMQKAGWNIAEIKLKVQGGLGLPDIVKPLREARTLDQTDLKAFEDLRSALRPGPLADAVAKLLKHHQGTTHNSVQTTEQDPAPSSEAKS
ncbi:MAG: DciA family protein [Burkholderiaceae bacterium]|nr:DciA family protein [Burkholderiaceae bacterium]